MKLQKISNIVSPFAGISFINNAFNECGNELGISSTSIGFSYSEIIRNFGKIFFSGGNCAEDIQTHFQKHLKSIPHNNVPSADTILRGIKEHIGDKIVYIENRDGNANVKFEQAGTLSRAEIYNFMKIKLILFSILLLNLNVKAQNDTSKLSIDVTADMVSRFVWRGMPMSSSPAIQPSLSVAYGKFSIGTWASYTIAQEGLQEIDLFINYESEYFSLTLNDYFNPEEPLQIARYCQYTDSITGHLLEGVLKLNGPESFPLSLDAGVMLYGNDKKENGDNYYSTYIGLNYTAEINEIEFTPFIGITPFESMYASKLEVVNLGVTAVKTLSISDKFELPLTANFILNPHTEMVFLVIGITL